MSICVVLGNLLCQAFVGLMEFSLWGQEADGKFGPFIKLAEEVWGQ
jgi:hypothetical protein